MVLMGGSVGSADSENQRFGTRLELLPANVRVAYEGTVDQPIASWGADVLIVGFYGGF